MTWLLICENPKHFATKSSVPLTPLEVDRQTMHAVRKYGIQIRYKTVKVAVSLEVKTFLLFPVLTFHRKSGKSCGFSEVNAFFG